MRALPGEPRPYIPSESEGGLVYVVVGCNSLLVEFFGSVIGVCGIDLRWSVRPSYQQRSGDMCSQTRINCVQSNTLDLGSEKVLHYWRLSLGDNETNFRF